MTAVNIWRDEQCAFMLTDSAIFLPGGEIMGFANKALMFGEIRLAIGVSGRAVADSLMPHLERFVTMPFLQSFLDALPQVLRSLWRETVKADGEKICLWIACFDQSRNAPRLLRISTDRMQMLPQDGGRFAKPFELVELSQPGYFNPPFGCDVFGSDVLPLGYVDDERSDGRRILSAQRRFGFPDGGEGWCGIGGECHLVRIGPAGMTGERVVRFPEQAGEYADPRRPGTPIIETPTAVYPPAAEERLVHRSALHSN